MNIIYTFVIDTLMLDKTLSLFLVEDDPMQVQMLHDHLSKFPKFKLKTFPTGEECMAKMDEKPDIVILDYNLDSVKKDAKPGLDILREIKEKKENTDVIMLSARDKIEVAVNTMKYGAFDYIIKNESAFLRIENTIYNIIRKNKLEKQVKTYKSLSIILTVCIILIIVGFFVADKMGYLAKTPGADIF
jgi:two-component system OmpR family response regulator